jgi:hypothetical protein
MIDAAHRLDRLAAEVTSFVVVPAAAAYADVEIPTVAYFRTALMPLVE